MTLAMFVASLLIVSVVAQAGHDLDIHSSPAFLIVGTFDGKIARCLYDSPEICETFHEGEYTWVTSSVVHGEYLYAALYSNKILRCEWDRKNSCEVYDETEDDITTLTVSDGYLYAGGGNFTTGVVVRCELNRQNSCSVLQRFPLWVRSIYELNNYMYIATWNSLLCCSKGAKFQCSNVRVEEGLGDVYSVSHLGNTIITLRDTGNDVRYYKHTASNFMNYIQKQIISGHVKTRRVTVFKRNVYVLKFSDDIEISEKYNDFKGFARHENVFSISFAYATHRMHDNAYGVGKCIEQSSSSAVFNYGSEHRAMLEARVVDGRLQDARGAVLDTRRADRGSSGPAAVFAMGPGGQLLLSRSHGSGLVDTSSLFAGQPVAGAGEILVEDGVVKTIIACSVAYWPDIKLNKQVVDELYRRGYDKADEIKLETCDYTCDRN